MTFRERVDKSPVGWLISVAAAAFIAGLLVMLGIMQVVVSDRGPRDRRLEVPASTPAITLQAVPTPVPFISLASPSPSGDLGMTAQEFARQFLELRDRFAEKEAFIVRAHGKHVRWRVQFGFPASSDRDVTLYFDVPSDDPTKPPYASPVRWAVLPLSMRDRAYALQPRDLIELEGMLVMSPGLSKDQMAMNADNFILIAKATPTPSAQ